MIEIKQANVEAELEVHERIAQHVRHVRAARGLTLEALAARSGVSRSMISLIERGSASPTAVVLSKLAAGLGVSLASLFAGPGDVVDSPKPHVLRREQAAWEDPESGYQRRSLSPPGWPSPLQLTDIYFPAGARVAYESIASNAALHQQVWVLQGQVDIALGAQTYSLAKGDCLAMQLDRPIIFRNPTRLTSRYLVAICDVSSFAIAMKASS